MTRRLPAAAVRSMVIAGGLVACVGVVVACVEVLSHALHAGEAGTWSWFGGAVALAIAVPVLRPTLERAADRAAYGRRGDPHALLAGFVHRISNTLAIDDVLPHLARAAAAATHSPSGGVRLWLSDGEERHETWPPGATSEPGEVTLLLEHDGHAVGRLEVAGADKDLRDVDRELLSRLAGPAGLALANVRLTLELRQRLAQTLALADGIRQSRQRMIDTGRDQRERFVAAIRQRVLTRLDAVDAHLAGVVEVDPADAVDRAPAALAHGALAAPALAVAELETRACLEALRDLAAGVFPPALAEHGLGPALEWQALRVEGLVSVQDEVSGHRYPALVEAAGYFCCAALVDEAEAGQRLAIELSGDADRLRFRAMGTAQPSPAAHQLMLDRVESLGGRLTVTVTGSSDVGEVAVCGEIPTDGVSVSTLLDRLGEPRLTTDPDHRSSS